MENSERISSKIRKYFLFKFVIFSEIQKKKLSRLRKKVFEKFGKVIFRDTWILAFEKKSFRTLWRRDHYLENSPIIFDVSRNREVLLGLEKKILLFCWIFRMHSLRSKSDIENLWTISLGMKPFGQSWRSSLEMQDACHEELGKNKTIPVGFLIFFFLFWITKEFHQNFEQTGNREKIFREFSNNF